MEQHHTVKHNNSSAQQPHMEEMDIDTIASNAVSWLKDQDCVSFKDITRTVQALALWDDGGGDDKYKHKPNLKSDLTHVLQESLSTCLDPRDMARAVMAAAASGIRLQGIGRAFESMQHKDGSWGDIYDTTYILRALSLLGMQNKRGCQWIVDNYDEKWEHVGTTALIIMALVEQGFECPEFIEEKARWVQAQEQSGGGWVHLATSNLAIQALMVVGVDVSASIKWLISKQDGDGGWKNISTTALSLITLWEYGGRKG